MPSTKGKNTPPGAGTAGKNTPPGAGTKPKARARFTPPRTPEPEIPWPTVGGKIEALIETRGLTIGGAAEMIGMSKQQLFRIIRIPRTPRIPKGKKKTKKEGVPNPGILTVQRIVRGLGGRMKDLFDEGDLVHARGEES